MLFIICLHVLEISTTDSQDYKFNPLNFGALHFSVKASNDAHIALTATKENKPPKYEVLFVTYIYVLFQFIIYNTINYICLRLSIFFLPKGYSRGYSSVLKKVCP